MKSFVGLLALAVLASAHPKLLSENVEIVQNDDGRTSRSEKPEMDILDHLTNYIKSHDVVATLPGSFLEGTTLTMSPRNLDNDEVTVSVKFSEDAKREGKALQEEGRKTKLKKIIVPLLVFVLLKAMTLVPLALGVLGIKAWNALQLSFFSFVVSLALAVFQLCKKLASDHGPGSPPHGPWDNYQAAHYAARSLSEGFPEEAQRMAYNAYSQS
ncbi:hypothetical protein RUM43_013052 [Polyplax serrata]|uniref:Osiris 19 n=1 Tax=Polyplax serrata TaxID=468196 RepID=A0AAN8PT99_POLSC